MPQKHLPKQTLGQNVLMRSIKILDIGYLTVIYVLLALLCAKVVDFLFGKFDEKLEKEKSLTRLSLEMVVSLWMYGVLIYAIRNITPLIPFPLNGFRGFDHFKVKEVYSPTVFTFVFLFYSNLLRNKILYFYQRLPKGYDTLGSNIDPNDKDEKDETDDKKYS